MKGIIVLCTLFLISCNSTKKIDCNNNQEHSMIFDGKIFTSLYQQNAAEYRALCLQAYNMAAIRLDQFKPTTKLPKAIITDIDETVLDNSPYPIHQALISKDFNSDSWFEWSSMSAADTVPGAPAFLKFASKLGVEIFYITNREERERDCTLKNLIKYDLPNADTNHLFLKSGTSSKEIRRQKVASTHEIVMLIGDNLGDFSKLFDKKTSQERTANVDVSLNEFGNKFIVIPNPNYGDWEGALLKYNYKLSSKQKDSVYRIFLKTY